MSDYAILLDLERCLGCTACVVACEAGNELAENDSYINIREEIRGQGMSLEGTFLHKRCLPLHRRILCRGLSNRSTRKAEWTDRSKRRHL
jgi:Fe-S-cluster-containing hydrogenase component 2